MLWMKLASFLMPARLYCFLVRLSSEKICRSPSKRLLALMRVVPADAFFSGLKEATMGFSELTRTAWAMASACGASTFTTSTRSRRLPVGAFSQYSITSFTSSPPYTPAPIVLAA